MQLCSTKEDTDRNQEISLFEQNPFSANVMTLNNKISVSIYVWQKLKKIKILFISILQISHTVGDTEEIDPFLAANKVWSLCCYHWLAQVAISC